MDRIRLNLYFAAADVSVECTMDAGICLQDHIRNICEMEKSRFSGIYRFSGNEIVYEQSTGQFCDTHVSLKALGLCSGRRLTVL